MPTLHDYWLMPRVSSCRCSRKTPDNLWAAW